MGYLPQLLRTGTHISKVHFEKLLCNSWAANCLLPLPTTLRVMGKVRDLFAVLSRFYGPLRNSTHGTG